MTITLICNGTLIDGAGQRGCAAPGPDTGQPHHGSRPGLASSASQSLPGPIGGPPHEAHLIFGADVPAMGANLARNMDENRMVLIEATAQRRVD